MPRPRRVATAALVGGTATFSGFYAFLAGEAMLARRTINVTDERPPVPDGVYGDDLPGRTIRCLVLGDSAAVGYGVLRADDTPAAMLGIGLAHVMDAPVDVHSFAVVGAQSSDLMGQIDLAMEVEPEPDLAVIIVGANDVTHGVRPTVAAAILGKAVQRLTDAGCEVVVGTCPDLGSVRPILQPLRAMARYWSRSIAREQTIAVVSAGGRAVSLGDLLGTLFNEKYEIMFGADRFHPSETGYANMVSVLVPAAAASLRERERAHAYASYAGPPRDLMPVADAAAEAAQHPGTQVVQEQGQNGRWATVLRRRRG
jgi:lysophospholipase L1-like esterase